VIQKTFEFIELQILTWKRN